MGDHHLQERAPYSGKKSVNELAGLLDEEWERTSVNELVGLSGEEWERTSANELAGLLKLFGQARERVSAVLADSL